MEITSRIVVYSVEEKEFTNAQNQIVKFVQAKVLLDNGDVIKVATTKEVLDTLSNESKIECDGTFSVSADSRQKPRIRLEKVLV